MDRRDFRSELVTAIQRRGGKINHRGDTLEFQCLLHDDTNPSAFLGDHRWGCSACGFNESFEDLARRLRVKLPNGDLTLPELAKRKCFDLAKCRDWGLETVETPRGSKAVAFPYLGSDGKVLRTKLRGSDGTWWGTGEGTYLYGLNRIPQTGTATLNAVLLVEGETDVLASWHHPDLGVLVLGVPGANAWKNEWMVHVNAETVYIWQEPGTGGKQFVRKIGKSFPHAWVLRPADGIKDLADLHKIAPDDFVERFERILGDATPLQDALTESGSTELELLSNPPVVSGESPQTVDEALNMSGLAAVDAGGPRSVVAELLDRYAQMIAPLHETNRTEYDLGTFLATQQVEMALNARGGMSVYVRDAMKRALYRNATGDVAWLTDGQFDRLPERTELIEGILPEDALALMFGKSEHGKTLVAMGMALCVGRGMPWHGQRVKRQPVAYVIAEGVGSLVARREAWLEVNVEDEDERNRPTNVYFYPNSTDLANADAVGDFLKNLNEELPEKPGLIVIDTLARCNSGNENDSQVMAQVVRSCDRIRKEVGATVLLIHHTGWENTTRERGHSSLRAATDTILQVKKEGDSVSVSCAKQKDDSHFPALRFELREAVGSVAACPVAYVGDALEVNKTDRELLRTLVTLQHNGEKVTSSMWNTTGGWPRSTFHRSLSKLKSGGYVLLARDNKHYTITDSGLQALGLPADTLTGDSQETKKALLRLLANREET
jgi:hypothetical protein